MRKALAFWSCADCGTSFDVRDVSPRDLSDRCPACGAAMTTVGQAIRSSQQRRATALTPAQAGAARAVLPIVRRLQPMTAGEASRRRLLTGLTAALGLRWVTFQAGGYGLTPTGADELRALTHQAVAA
ncbi:MAG TPA: hypothetical protein VHN99_02245 [Deinococcales bacterium]|nr:hypothetical protein [Deinococcales bacterium]